MGQEAWTNFRSMYLKTSILTLGQPIISLGLLYGLLVYKHYIEFIVRDLEFNPHLHEKLTGVLVW